MCPRRAFYHKKGGNNVDYYLVMPDDEEGIMLGTQSFGFFYADAGFDFLSDLAENQPELIKFVKIITDRGLQYSVEDFLRLFEGEDCLQMRKRT